MTLTILRGKSVVTTVTLTYDDAHWTPFKGEEELAQVLRGTFQIRSGRVIGASRVGIITTLPLCARSADAAYNKITQLGYEVESDDEVEDPE